MQVAQERCLLSGAATNDTLATGLGLGLGLGRAAATQQIVSQIWLDM